MQTTSHSAAGTADLFAGMQANGSEVLDGLRRGTDRMYPGKTDARNAEAHLVERGMDVPASRFAVPEEGVSGRPNRGLNQYTPGTMMQVLDGFLATGGDPVAQERARERKLFRDGLEAAEGDA